MTPYEEQRKKIRENTNANMFARDSYSSQITPIGKDPIYRGFNDPRSFNPDLDTPEGLYSLAHQAGLGEQAEKMVKKSGGESGKFFSGGLVMDAMDILNIASYGVVGMAKGKGFIEGVKNRESFSDDDSLGKYGWTGKVGGFILDIALDPFTYIAPWKVVTKIPGITSSLANAQKKLLGEMVEITIDGQTTFKREGGYELLKMLPDKLVYGFAADRKYLDGQQKIIGKAEALAGEIDQMVGVMAKSDTKLLDQTLQVMPDGRMGSKKFEDIQKELMRDLSPEEAGKELGKVKQLYDARDALMKELVDYGVISKAAAEEHWGTYLRQTYDEFLEAKGGFESNFGVGITNKKRVEGLTPEKMKELGQVQNAGVLWGKTMIKQIDLLKKAKLQRYIADNFSLTSEQLAEFERKGGKMEDLHKVSDSSAFKMKGNEANLTLEANKASAALSKVLKQRKIALKDEKELVEVIERMEKQLENLKTGSADEISEAISGMKKVLVENGITKGKVKKVPTSEGQVILKDTIVAFLKKGSKSDRLALETIPTKTLLKDFLKTKEGLALERAFNDPKAMYQWNSMEEFFDAVRYPDRSIVYKEGKDSLEQLTDAESLAKIKRAEEKARKYGDIEQTKKILSETNLQLVQENLNKLEDAYADLSFKKQNILAALEENKMGQLGGKYVSKELWTAVRNEFEPRKEIGENLVMRFKHAKVIWNPGSYARNALSGLIQNWWELGIGPWRVDIYYDAIKEMKHNGPALREMKEEGFSLMSGQIQELTNNYLSGKHIEKSLAAQLGSKSKAIQAMKHADKQLVNAYGYSDNIAKIAAYKHGRKLGLSKSDALKRAYEATYNYSEVTPFVHSMRRAIWGVPFVTFSLKSIPLVARTLAENPHRISVFGKARNDLFKAAGIEGEQEQEALPDYMRDDQFLMRLPWKDGNGRSMYFDMSYILPFGAILDGGYLKDPIGTNPVLQLTKELSNNKTFGGTKIFRESDDIDTVLMDISLHIGKTMLPPSVAEQFSKGYSDNGERVPGNLSKFAGTDTQDLGPNERSFYQESARLLGANVSPYDLKSKERQLAYKQKENLTKLLVENDIMKEFRSPYLPKDSELKQSSEMFIRDAKPIGR